VTLHVAHSAANGRASAVLVTTERHVLRFSIFTRGRHGDEPPSAGRWGWPLIEHDANHDPGFHEEHDLVTPGETIHRIRVFAARSRRKGSG
jgi:hypothetical protein